MWIIRHLLGVAAAAHLDAVVKAFVAFALLSNAALSKDAAVAQASVQAETLVNSVLVHHPAWLSGLLKPMLLGDVGQIAGVAYDQAVLRLLGSVSGGQVLGGQTLGGQAAGGAG